MNARWWCDVMRHTRVVLAERERCARIADERARIWRANRNPPKASEAEAIAHEIRNAEVKT